MYKGSFTEENHKQVTLYEIIALLGKSKSFDLTLQQICDTIPKAYAPFGSVSVKISIDHKEFVSKNFNESKWLERETFNIQRH